MKGQSGFQPGGYGKSSGGGLGDMILNAIQTVTGLKIFQKLKLAILGSSTGKNIIDSANASAEVDGLIIVRTWRDAGRTADTLDVNPFLHFVDIHYQSTQLPTKGRNYPFY